MCKLPVQTQVGRSSGQHGQHSLQTENADFDLGKFGRHPQCSNAGSTCSEPCSEHGAEKWSEMLNKCIVDISGHRIAMDGRSSRDSYWYIFVQRFLMPDVTPSEVPDLWRISWSISTSTCGRVGCPEILQNRAERNMFHDVSCCQVLSITVSTFHPDFMLMSLNLHPLPIIPSFI